MANLKKIILVLADSRGVNQAFITDDFQYLLLEEAIALVRRQILAGVHIVEGRNGNYIRSNLNETREDNLDSLSVPAGSLSKKIKTLEDQRISAYAKAYSKFLELRYEREELLYLDGIAWVSQKDVNQRIRPLAKDIKDAAVKYGVDPYLLGAVLIDEFARMGPDDLLDILGKLGVRDTTVGLAQVKMSTARDLIKKKYYSANPNISQSKLYDLLTDDKESVQFAAAYLSFIKILRASNNYGTSAWEIASCYSRGQFSKPASPRGKQIATKLRPFAREVLD